MTINTQLSALVDKYGECKHKILKCKQLICQKKHNLYGGLDNAGKTTILHHLKAKYNIEAVSITPIIGFHVETISDHHLTLSSWDLGSEDTHFPGDFCC